MKDLETEIGLDRWLKLGHSLVACFPVIAIHCQQAELRRKDL